MARRATVTEADPRRAIKAAKDCGLVIHECIMTPAEVRLIFTAVDVPKENDDTPRPKEWAR
jgi:hypothetical protein